MVNLRKPPIGFRKKVAEFFFNHLEKGDLEKFLETIESYKQKGLDTDCFYWMYKELTPSEKELKEILEGEDYLFNPTEVKSYLERFKKFQERI